MDQQLRHFNKINANFGFMIDDLRQRHDDHNESIKYYRAKIRLNK